jgi:hypothetical protein
MTPHIWSIRYAGLKKAVRKKLVIGLSSLKFLLNNFKNFYDEDEIRRFYAILYILQQNRVIERKNMIILNMIRSILKKNMLKEFLEEAVQCAVDV